MYKHALACRLGILAVAAAAVAGTPRAFAQNANDDAIAEMRAELRQMQGRMEQAEQRADKADQRATAAEAKVTDLEKQFMGTQMRYQAMVKKDAADADKAKKTQAAAQAQADYDKGNPKDYKGIALPPPDEKPYATLDVNYFYMRTGVGTYIQGGARESNDGRNTAFVNPLVSDNNAGRLGNELDTYLEPSFKVLTTPFKDPNVTFGAVFTFSSYNAQRTQIDLPTNLATLDLYCFGKGAIPFLPGAEVWAGRRGYEYQFYMNIIDRRSYVIGGDGGGINNIALGDFAQLDIAYLTASPTGGTQSSVNPLNPTGSTYGDIRTDNGNLDKQSVFLRLHDIKTPLIGGQLSIMGQYQYSAGGKALVSGDFQGSPGNSVYNNLNYDGGIRIPEADGFSVALVQDNKYDLVNGDLKVINHFFLGAGWGTAFDTTNADKLRSAPFYAVPDATLAANNNVISTLADAHAFKFADQIDFYYKDKIEVEAYAIYEYQNSGRPDEPIFDPELNNGAGGTVKAKGIQNWIDVGVRPAYNFTPFFSLEAELTYNYIDNRAYDAIREAAGFDAGHGDLFKFTIAPTFHYGKAGNYPLELHFYYTFAAWNDALKGSVVGGDPNRNRNTGHLFGTQAVINF